MNAIQKFVLTTTAATILAADARAGRWLSRDPIEEGAGFIQRDPISVPQYFLAQPGQHAQRMTRSAGVPTGRLVLHQTANGVVRFVIEPQSSLSLASRGDPNLYAFVLNDPENNVDRLGLDVVNNSDLSAWVYISGTGPGTGWLVINPGQTIRGDTDMICPNVSGRVQGSDGLYSCLKIIDCFDAVISGSVSGAGPIRIDPVYAGITAGRGNNFQRKCCCAIPICAYHFQSTLGGSVNPLTVAPSLPPDYPP
jgi:hypothetical protein